MSEISFNLERPKKKKKKSELGITNIDCAGCGKKIRNIYIATEKGDFCSSKCFYGETV